MDANKKSEEFCKRVEAFKLKMKRRQIQNALNLAKRTLELMRELLAIHKHEDPLVLINHVREVGKGMIDARPQELVVGNAVRRVMHLIREVAAGEGLHVTSDQVFTSTNPQPPSSSRPVSLLTLLDSRNVGKPHDGEHSAVAAAAAAATAPGTSAPTSTAPPPSPPPPLRPTRTPQTPPRRQQIARASS
eukprot:jgi/Ulvmu1/6910/UM031_0117.1